MRLKKVLKEVEFKDPKTSWDAFNQAYNNLVKARKMIERSLVLGKMELNRSVNDLNHRYKERIKKKDGTLVSPLDAHEKKTAHFIWNKRQVDFLKQTQDLESTWMSLLSSRGLSLLDDQDIEEKSVFYVKDETEDDA